MQKARLAIRELLGQIRLEPGEDERLKLERERLRSAEKLLSAADSDFNRMSLRVVGLLMELRKRSSPI